MLVNGAARPIVALIRPLPKRTDREPCDGRCEDLHTWVIGRVARCGQPRRLRSGRQRGRLQARTDRRCNRRPATGAVGLTALAASGPWVRCVVEHLERVDRRIQIGLRWALGP